MYLKAVKIRHLGAIEGLSVETRLDEQSKPVPIAFVGQNGAGKSLTLSVILDAITEARRHSFSNIPEVDKETYLRISSKNYVKFGKGFSQASADFSGDGTVHFSEIVSRIPFEQFMKEAPELAELPGVKGGEFSQSGFHKNCQVDEKGQKDVRELNFLYFPYFRYEPAYWMSKAANVDFVSSDNFYGQARTNPIRTNIIEEMKRWILNVLLDREIYEKKTAQVLTQWGASVTALRGYEGPNTNLFNMVNQLLTRMLKAKDSTVTSARVGIGPKGKREISVFITRGGEPEALVVADLGQMSSGELMTLGLATEILRSYELVSGTPPASLDKVTGIVLVDEIDLHLHISFQGKVLPAVLRMFPHVQFIVTTHSPFFLLGMAETGKIDIYELPLGNEIEASEFKEFESAYELMLEEDRKFRGRYLALKGDLAKSARPLVVTEGKTDWQHMKAAIAKVKQVGEFPDLEVDFLEFGSELDMGDDKLSKLCEYLSSLPNSRKTIFIFDRDNQTIVKNMSGGNAGYRELGNMVYSLCIPIPDHREGYTNISIEHCYLDEEIAANKTDDGRRLWFSNEIDIITHPTSGAKEFRVRKEPLTGDERAKKVFDQPVDQIIDEHGNKVGLSKARFADLVLTSAAGFGDMSRSGFTPLLQVLRDICRIGE